MKFYVKIDFFVVLPDFLLLFVCLIFLPHISLVFHFEFDCHLDGHRRHLYFQNLEKFTRSATLARSLAGGEYESGSPVLYINL